MDWRKTLFCRHVLNGAVKNGNDRLKHVDSKRLTVFGAIRNNTVESILSAWLFELEQKLGKQGTVGINMTNTTVWRAKLDTVRIYSLKLNDCLI